MIKLVKQQRTGDCGVACIAMLANIDYDTAWYVSSPYMNHSEGNIPFESFLSIFNRLGFKGIFTSLEPREKQNSGLCEITYNRDGKKTWHYIVWDSEQKLFLDPQKKPQENFVITKFLEILKKK